MTTTIQANVPFLNARTGIYTAWNLREFSEGDPPGPGVADYNSFRVIQRQAGANLSVDIGITAVGLMQAWVRGGTRDGQGLYRCTNVDYTAPTANTFLAQLNEAGFTAADGTNPRIDQVVLEVLDQQHAGASNVLQTRVVTGTATGGATLDNRTGAAATPAGCILLADCLIPALATTVTTANIRDRRAFPLAGTVPPLLTAVDMVTFLPHAALTVTDQACQSTVGFDSAQAAALMYLPRRIAAATRIRWKYAQSGTANSANYILAIFDASGRLIVPMTSAQAYAGAASSETVRSETIAATTFEPGWYYVFIGNAPGIASAAVSTHGPLLNVAAASSQVGANAPNLAVRAAAGGTTVPTTLLALTDVSSIVTTQAIPVVPVISLSVG